MLIAHFTVTFFPLPSLIFTAFKNMRAGVFPMQRAGGWLIPLTRLLSYPDGMVVFSLEPVCNKDIEFDDLSNLNYRSKNNNPVVYHICNKIDR